MIKVVRVDQVAELEASNSILRKYKTIYQSAQSITCATCKRAFKPVHFKAHMNSCKAPSQKPKDHQDF